MEEIRKLAMIYYAKLSYDQKQWSRSLFKKIDVNGDGKVTVQEFFGYFITGGSDYLEKLFMFLDKNHNGTLDFEECVTFFYMIASNRLLQCDGCGSLLLGAYFLCVECYNVNREKTYDLCCSCYGNNFFSHPHSYFLDNYALLLQKEIKSNSAAGCSSQKHKEPTGRFGLYSRVDALEYNPDPPYDYISYSYPSPYSGPYSYPSIDSILGNTSQGLDRISKREKINKEVQNFLNGFKFASTVFHIAAAAHVLGACAIM